MKIKVSILTRIALLLVAALIIATAITVTISYHAMLKDAEEQSVNKSTTAATAAMVAIGSEEGFYALYKDEALRENVHKTFRFICKRTGLRYLYLYTIGEDGLRHYVICAAKSDADDQRLQDEYGFGSVRETQLYQAEDNVLAGNTDENYELIDNEFGWVCMTITPVMDSDNNIIALIGADDYIQDVKRIAMRDLLTLLLISMIIVFISFIIALLLIRRSVILPIQALSDRMRNFVSNRREHVADRRKTVYVDEITDIENAFEKMTEDIDHYVGDIETLTRQQVYTQTQLDVARKIQSGIVPREFELSGDGFEVYGCMIAAKEVGGDFYDVFRLDDGQIGVVIGDISDKGIPAALFMAMVKTSIKEKLRAGRGLAETLNLVNRELCVSNPGNMFATVFAMTLHPETGIVTYANGGHEAPLMLGQDPSFRKVASGIAIGLFEDSDIGEEKLVLRSGDGMLLYTDGITEAIDADRKMYGKNRLRETVSRGYREDVHSYDARALVTDTVESVIAYTSGMEQFDDITCLAVSYKDAGEAMKTLSPDIGSFEIVKDTILSSLGESDRTKRVILACEEIFVNIVHYAGADQISFGSKRVGNTWLVTYIDNGIAFDPVKAERKDLEFEKLDQGGMGIMAARMNSREMIYNRIDGRNVLTMVFDADDI